MTSRSPKRLPRVSIPDLKEVVLKIIDAAYRDLPYGIANWSELWREVKRHGSTCSLNSLKNMLKKSKEKIILRTVKVPLNYEPQGTKSTICH